MSSSLPPHAPAPSTQARPGFALLIVLALLMLITIIAVTYLRTMRLRMLPPNQFSGSIERVMGSVLELAETQIANDMPVAGSDQENYDYPWTDASATLMPASLTYPTPQNGLFTAGNPARDDAWLATAYIAGGKWPHLSNLTGAFLDVDDSNLTKVALNLATHRRVPSDKLSKDFSPSAPVETNVDITDKRLVDADGDGIGDSLWFYPPFCQSGSVRYVAALYIEDLSGKLNLNTALPLRAAGQYPAGALQGLHPSEVDLSAATVPGVFATPATDTDLNRVIQYRSKSLAVANTEGGRWGYWGNFGSHASLAGDPLAKDPAPADNHRYKVDNDEYELRFHGGLNDSYTLNVKGGRTPKVAMVETADSGLSSLLRATNTETLTERNWKDAGFTDPAAWTTQNPRRWLTTLSGEADRQIGINTPLLSEAVRWNLNIRNDVDYGTVLCDKLLTPWFQGVDVTAGTLNGVNDDYPFPKGWSQFVDTTADTSHAARPAQFARALCANLIDARDRDNFLTKNADWYGFEPLPVLTEVYLQRLYAKKGDLATFLFEVSCSAYNSECSYAVEIVNPYHFPVKLTDITFDCRVPGVKSAGPAFLLSSVLPASWPDKDLNGSPVLLPGHKILLWRNGDAGTTGISDPNLKIDSKLAAITAAAIAAQDNSIHLVESPLVIQPQNDGVDFMQFNLNCKYQSPADKSSAGDFDGYSYLTVPWPNQSLQERTTLLSIAGTNFWNLLADGTEVGIMQVDVQGWGVGEGLNTLQCRPARQNRMTFNHSEGTFRGTAADDAGDMLENKIFRYRKPSANYDRITRKPGYDAALLNDLGQNLKTNAFPRTNGSTRIDLKGEKLWHATARNQKDQGQFNSLADAFAVPAIVLCDGASNSVRGPLTNKNSGGIYTDTDVGHWLYTLLENGTQPLSSLCLSLNPATPYDPKVNATKTVTTTDEDGVTTTTTITNPNPGADTRNVPWGWLTPGFMDTVNPAMYGGYDWAGSGSPQWFSSQENSAKLDVKPRFDPANGFKDWPAEADTAQGYLVPGRINLNTMPPHLLREVLPIKDETLRHAVADTIATRRAGQPAPGTRAATDQGLSSVFEVFQDAKDMSGFQGAPTSRHALADNLGCLTNMAACRSDFFAMHLIVQGYNREDFSPGPLESQRWLIILSRAPVTTPGAKGSVKNWQYRY